jgi:hypothetical protein
MKVSLIHPERRTMQSIGLDGPQLPKRLGPTQRHTFTIERGKFVDFTAATHGKSKYGSVQLDIDIEAEEGETLRPGMVTYSPLNPSLALWVPRRRSSDSLMVGGSRDPQSGAVSERKGRASLVLQPGTSMLIVIANPAEDVDGVDLDHVDTMRGSEGAPNG